jgi:DNA/RNA endonuclease YhcR with UshA esterase domain
MPRKVLEITAAGEIARTPDMVESSEVATVPTTNAIPRANANGQIDAGWIPDSVRTVNLQEQDGAPVLTNIATIIVGNGDLTYVGAGIARIKTASDSSANLTVREIDGSPSVTPVSVIEVPNGSLTDLGDGTVRLTVSGGGGGSLTITDASGTPTVTGIATIKVGDGDVVEEETGTVRIYTRADAVGAGVGAVLYLWRNFV